MVESMSEGPGALDLVHLIDGVMVLDSKGAVVAFSEGAERITGFMASEIVGKTCQEVFRSNTCEIACPARRTFETGVVLSNCRCHIFTRDDDEIEIVVPEGIKIEVHGLVGRRGRRIEYDNFCFGAVFVHAGHGYHAVTTDDHQIKVVILGDIPV